MRLQHVSRLVCLVVPLVVVLGCGETPSGRVAKKSGSSKSKRKLAKLGEYFGPLDDGRIEAIAPPKGWNVAPRSGKFVCRFHTPGGESYPSIIVRSEDYEKISNVSDDNVGEFAKQIARSYRKGKLKQSMTITPIRVGEFVGISYQRRGKAPHGYKTIIVNRLILDTVVAGRKYTIELQTRDDDTLKHRRYLEAVAAGIKFGSKGIRD